MAEINESQLQTLCAALGWQGGTYWQVVDEIRRLKAEVDADRRGPGEHRRSCAMHYFGQAVCTCGVIGLDGGQPK